ncbi:MAG: hypothetical protein HY063_11970 [Bacteroidetes bacterium]|nr:hypothetical protein [Bacteroidota bacterium]
MFRNFFILLILLACKNSFAQSANNKLILGTEYGSNTVYIGEAPAQKLPYLNASADFTLSFGLWLNVTAYHLLESNLVSDETRPSVGWDIPLSKHWTFTPSYTHFFFAPESPLPHASLLNDWAGELAYSKKMEWMLDADYLTGNGESDYYFSIDADRPFYIPKILGKNDELKIMPDAVAYFGTTNFYSSYQNKNGMPIGNGGAGHGHHGQGQGGGGTSSGSGSSFSVISIIGGLPVHYYAGGFDLYFTPSCSFLPNDAANSFFYFQTGLNYFFASAHKHKK